MIITFSLRMSEKLIPTNLRNVKHSDSVFLLLKLESGIAWFFVSFFRVMALLSK